MFQSKSLAVVQQLNVLHGTAQVNAIAAAAQQRLLLAGGLSSAGVAAGSSSRLVAQRVAVPGAAAMLETLQRQVTLCPHPACGDAARL